MEAGGYGELHPRDGLRTLSDGARGRQPADVRSAFQLRWRRRPRLEPMDCNQFHLPFRGLMVDEAS
jgi:hypothetical protein